MKNQWQSESEVGLRPISGDGRGSVGQSQRRRRTGLMGWWIDLTAPPLLSEGSLRLDQRERLRKAELTSYSILGVFAFLVALVSNSLASMSTAQAVVTMAVFLIITAILNRVGRMRAAAYLLPSALMLLIALSVVAAPGLNPIGLPIFDLFVIPIILVSFIGNRQAAWFYALIAIAFIAADYTLQPHTFVQAAGVNHFDELAYEQAVYGWWGMINRHVALCFFAALFGWLGARSVDDAIRRADRAEEVADLERRELENKRQIEVAAQHLLEVHTRVANGDFNSRAALDRGNVLWSVGQSLNNLLQRLQRQGHAEYQLRRTEEEAQRLATALDEVNAGRYPLWPARANTVVDLLIDRVAMRGPQTGRGPAVQQQAFPPQQRPHAPLPPPGFTPSGPGGQSIFPPSSAPLPPQMPESGIPEGWPSLSPMQPSNQPNQSGERPMQTSDNPWFLPPEGNNW